MRRFMRFLIFSTLILVVAITLTIVVAKVTHVGDDWRDATYNLVFGKPDIAIVDFQTLKRRTSPNDALACPRETCAAKPDRLTETDKRTRPEIWTVIEGALFARKDDRRSVTEESTPVSETRVYVVRTPSMRFPDVLQVSLTDSPAGGTMIAIYSASQIGYSDMGANLKRIDALLKALEAQP
jgi:hypothetical protein